MSWSYPCKLWGSVSVSLQSINGADLVDASLRQLLEATTDPWVPDQPRGAWRLSRWGACGMLGVCVGKLATSSVALHLPPCSSTDVGLSVWVRCFIITTSTLGGKIQMSRCSDALLCRKCVDVIHQISRGFMLYSKIHVRFQCCRQCLQVLQCLKYGHSKESLSTAWSCPLMLGISFGCFLMCNRV